MTRRISAPVNPSSGWEISCMGASAKDGERRCERTGQQGHGTGSRILALASPRAWANTASRP